MFTRHVPFPPNNSLVTIGAVQRLFVKCPKCTVLGHNNITLSATGSHNGGHGAQSEPRKIYGIDGFPLTGAQ